MLVYIVAHAENKEEGGEEEEEDNIDKETKMVFKEARIWIRRR